MRELSLFSQGNIQTFLLFLLSCSIPIQLGRHFWPSFTIVAGQRIDYLSPTLYLTDIFILFFIVFTFFTKKIRIPMSFYVVLLILSIGVYQSQTPLAGWYGIAKFVELFFLGLALTNMLETGKQMTAFSLGLSCALIVQAGLAIAQSFLQRSLGGIWYFFGERTFTVLTPGIARASLHGDLFLRPYGTFSHPNVLAGFVLFVLTILLFSRGGRAWEEKGKSILLFLGSVLLLLTLSRVAILVWIFYLLLRFFTSAAHKKEKKREIISMILLSVVVVAFFITPLLFRFSEISFGDESIQQRIVLLQQSIHLILQKPTFGVGFGNYFIEVASQRVNIWGWQLQPPHNIFVLFLAETGVLGFMFAMWFLYRTIQRVVISQGKWKILLLGIFIILGSFDHYFLTSQQGQLVAVSIFSLCWASPLLT